MACKIIKDMQFTEKGRESLTFIEAWKVANCSKELAVIDRNIPKCCYF